MSRHHKSHLLRWRGEPGFTLIELLVVIIILGILAAVVVFAVGGVGDKGASAAREIDERTLRTAEEVYFANNGRYATEAELVARGFLSGESDTHKIYLDNSLGACSAGDKCDYTIALADETPEIVVYSGRTATLVNPLLTAFTNDTGITVQPLSTIPETGNSTSVANRIVSEGAGTPADVFFSQDAGNLGVVSRANLLATAPPGAAGKVIDPKFVAQDGTWVGVSGRVRVIAHNPDKVPPANVPTSVFDLTQPTWSGKVGYDPTNGSFQNFVAAMILTHGQPATQQWLTDFKANSPVRIAGNLNVAKAVANAANPVQLGLINHYYRFQLTPAEQADMLNTFPIGGDPGSLVNVAGAGVLKNTANPGASEAFVKYLLSKLGQTYFRDQTFEYPLIPQVPPSASLVPLDQIQSPDIDLNEIDNNAAVALLTSTNHLP